MPKEAKEALTTAQAAETADSEAQKFYEAFLAKYSTDETVVKEVAEKVVIIVKAVKELGASPDEAKCNALITLSNDNDIA